MSRWGGDAQFNLPDSSKKLTVDLKPGTSEWYCPIGNHRAQGTEGKLTIQ